MKTADRITSILLLALSGLWIYWAHRLPYPKFAQVSKMGPGDFPTMVAVMLAACAIWLLIETFRRPDAKPRGTDEDSEETESIKNPAARRDILNGFGLFTLLLILIPFLGFSLTAAVFVFSFLVFIGRYKVYAALPIGVLIPGLLWFIFAYLLTVPLPKGPWGF